MINNPYQTTPMMNNNYMPMQNPYADRMNFLQNYQQSLQQPVAGTQMSLANQQPMPQQIAGINGRIVQAVEDINANEVPMDGSMAFFPKQDMSKIYVKLKRVVKGIVRNYRKELKRRRNKEISYCELPEIVVEKLAVWDEYESDYTAFDVCGIEVRVLDDDLAEAIKYLSEKDREILLMYFFLGMSDTEIGDRLKINRSTSFRSRKNSLEEIKKKLKENMNDE